jgi:hypothetical protein
MATRKLLVGIGISLVLIVLTAIVVVVAQPQRRELSRTANPDGTSTVMIGQQRLWGVMGIEIIRQQEDAGGRVLSASVKGECWSWSEARRKYAAGR